MLCLLLCFGEIGSAIQPYLEIPSNAFRLRSFSIALSRNNVICETALFCPSVTICEQDKSCHF